jgi:CMP-N-acetylneuraminic acid synthetase
MKQGKTFLAIIPARGGSKRLHRKNLLELDGKPLIAWSIETSLKSKYIDKVIVSSDDNEIISIAKKYSVQTIKRPHELATDTASTIDVVKHAIENIKENFEFTVLLQPTSPLRNEKHIDEAINLLDIKNADAVISVCEVEHSPLWCNTLPKDRSMKDFIREDVKNKRSQDLPTYYRINGAIYICKTEKLLEEKSFFLKDNIFAYVMDRKDSVDIDTMEDFYYASVLLNNKIIYQNKIIDEIFESYTRRGFGKILKSEIDVILFDFVMKKIFSEINPEYFINGELNYFALDKKDIYELSKYLKIPEIKIVNYIEQVGLLKGILSDEVGFINFKNLLFKQKQNLLNIQKGSIAIQITNKLMQKYIEAKISSVGGQYTYDKGSDLIFFDIVTLLEIFNIKKEGILEWIKLQDNKEAKEIITLLSKENYSLKDVGEKLTSYICSVLRSSSINIVSNKLMELFYNGQLF